jgi:hypothetical protein
MRLELITGILTHFRYLIIYRLKKIKMERNNDEYLRRTEFNRRKIVNLYKICNEQGVWYIKFNKRK